MDWDCTRTEEQLSDFLDGALTAEEAAAFSSHGVSCDRCAKLVADVRGLVTRIKQVPEVAEPAQLQRKILDATLGPRPQRPARPGWFAWLPVIWDPRFAMGIVTVAASFAIVFHAAASEGGRANLNPANLLRGANRQIHLTYARGARFVNNLRVVYEIQSKLSAPPESLSEPIAPSPTRPTDHPQPDKEQQEKSQTFPRTDRRGIPSGPELAYRTRDFTESALQPAFRSLL